MSVAFLGVFNEIFLFCRDVGSFVTHSSKNLIIETRDNFCPQISTLGICDKNEHEGQKKILYFNFIYQLFVLRKDWKITDVSLKVICVKNLLTF